MQLGLMVGAGMTTGAVAFAATQLPTRSEAPDAFSKDVAYTGIGVASGLSGLAGTIGLGGSSGQVLSYRLAQTAPLAKAGLGMGAAGLALGAAWAGTQMIDGLRSSMAIKDNQ